MNRIPHASLIVIALMVLVSSAGCRNRCNNGCGGGLFANNGTIAPPPTYSLNIPSAGQNQAYYQRNGGPISTTARAPVSRTSIPNSNTNLQWRQPNSGNAQPGTSTFGSQQQVPPQQNNSASTTRLVELSPGANNGSSVLVGGAQARLASATQPLPATGSSFTDSRNFATTQIDERFDATRVPVTDATRVRATAQNYIAATAAPVPPQQTYAAQPVVRPGQAVYATNGYIVPSQPQSYTAQTYLLPGSNNPSYSASANNAVGWRGRELGSQAR